jgi:uncharacterized membrane protein HdeD (DUF308 family)
VKVARHDFRGFEMIQQFPARRGFGGVSSSHWICSVLLYLSQPWSGLWVLGTITAVELVMHGVSWPQSGFSPPRLARSAV